MVMKRTERKRQRGGCVHARPCNVNGLGAMNETQVNEIGKGKGGAR